MNIDERLANRNFLVDSNKYDNGGTIGRYIFNAGFVNSSIDNMVINSTGKKNGLPFLTALKNGGHYQNNAFFGGNFVLGEGLFDKVPGISMKNDSPTRFLSDKSFFGYKAQYYNAKSTETMFTDDMIKGIGGNKDFIIQSGVGFSKDYTKFFGTLNRQGFSISSTERAVNGLPIGGVHDFKEYYKHGSKVSKENVAEYKRLIEEKYKNIPEEKIGPTRRKSKGGKTPGERNTGNRATKKRTVEARTIDDQIDDVLKGNTKDIDFVNNPETVNTIKGNLQKHVLNASDEEIFELTKNMNFGKKAKKTIEQFGTKNLNQIAKYKTGGINNTISNTEKLKMYDDVIDELGIVTAKPLEKEGLKRTAKKRGSSTAKQASRNKTRKISSPELNGLDKNASMGEKIKKVNEWLENAKKGKVNKTTEAGEVIDKTIKKVYAEKEKIINSGDDLMKTLRTDILDDIGKEFFNMSSLNKFFSNRYVQVATGNYLKASVGIPLAVATGFISAGAFQHQEQSINNFRDMFSYDNTPVLDYHSEEALRTGYQHQQLSASNDQDIHYIKGNRNIASRYANDISPIDIDINATKLSSFTTI